MALSVTVVNNIIDDYHKEQARLAKEQIDLDVVNNDVSSVEQGLRSGLLEKQVDSEGDTKIVRKMSYETFVEKNKYAKLFRDKKTRNVVTYRIDRDDKRLSLKDNGTVVLLREGANKRTIQDIPRIMSEVEHLRWYITNPSVLQNWNGWA